jgi:hypothetical protein
MVGRQPRRTERRGSLLRARQCLDGAGHADAMMANGMRPIWRVIRGDWLPLPAVFPVLFLSIVGLQAALDGRIRLAGAIGGAVGGTIGTVLSRRRRR